jgi:hypothetical protein
MEDNNRPRRQDGSPLYPESASRYGQGQARSFNGNASERFRPAPLTQSPTAGRAGVPGAGAYGYYNDAGSAFPQNMPANSMQYASEYTPESQRSQHFTTYNPNMMYTVPQQASQNAVYDNSQQFQPRQPAAMQMLSEVAAPYFPGEPTGAAAPPVLHHQASSSSSNAYQQNPADRASMIQGYPAALPGMGGMSQPAVPEAINEYEAAQDLEGAHDQYQNRLIEIFANVSNGMLVEASESLLHVSEWLLSHVEQLGKMSQAAHARVSSANGVFEGLTVDKEALYPDRIKLWNDFNNAWLCLLQKQKDVTEDMQASGHGPRSPRSVIPLEQLEKMGKDLVKLADAIEKHGLVDYQYGVMEENIMDSKYLPPHKGTSTVRLMWHSSH